MAYNHMANDVSLQQFSELWESSRFSHRMPADPDSLTHLLEKSEHELPDLSLCEMAHRTVTGEMDHGSRRLRVNQESRGLRLEHVTNSMTEDVGNSKGSVELEESDEDKNMLPKLGTPSWLSNALLRQQAQVAGSDGNEGVSTKWCSSCGNNDSHCMCGNIQAPSPTLPNHPYTDWFSAVPSAVPMVTTHPGESSGDPGGTSSRYMESMSHMSDQSRGSDHQRLILGLQMDGAGTSNDPSSGYGPNAEEKTQDTDVNMEDMSHQERLKNWQEARMKAKMLTHPLFSQMLAAHVGCLRIATPVDQLQKIDEQLSQSQLVIDKYSVFAPEEGEDIDDKEELDEFMRNYTLVLMDMQERLENHVRVHATEAMMGCWELEQQLYALTGVSPGNGTGATMSDEEEEPIAESDPSPGFEPNLDVQDTGGFGPLVPTETERSLMERVRQELKLELNEQGYRDKIVDVREEILRKRRAGKLPEGTTTVLKAWWNAHSKWPYPTEDEKERLIQETGLELKQVNNWFINQRKRNWHSNPLSSSNELKNKRKS